MLLEAAIATCDHYIDDVTAADGIPYWDAGAPGLAAMPDWRDRARRSVQRSRAGRQLRGRNRARRDCCGWRACSRRAATAGARSLRAGRPARRSTTLFDESGPYLSRDPAHQGLLLHSVYHWPNRWDYVPGGATMPRGESSQWGDYHAREAGAATSSASRDGGRTSRSSRS